MFIGKASHYFFKKSDTNYGSCKSGDELSVFTGINGYGYVTRQKSFVRDVKKYQSLAQTERKELAIKRYNERLNTDSKQKRKSNVRVVVVDCVKYTIIKAKKYV